MNTAQRIKNINDLNDLGIRLACTPTMQDALRLHEIAADLSCSEDVPLDYLLISHANLGFALRQLGDYDTPRGLLESDFMGLVGRALKTYSGIGRVFEELGLIVADDPRAVEPEKRMSAITKGLDYFNYAIGKYREALVNSVAEVYTPQQLIQRELRTMGMRAPKARNLGELTMGEESCDWFNKAVDYAQEEVNARKAMGETSGQNLANAYHSLGQALTEIVSTNPENYHRAREAFDKAAAVPGVQENTLITLQLRRAWLEYRKDATLVSVISPSFDTFLAGVDKLTEADKNALRGRVVELGDHLGGDYRERAKLF